MEDGIVEFAEAALELAEVVQAHHAPRIVLREAFGQLQRIAKSLLGVL
jgi:hypothetical protein